MKARKYAAIFLATILLGSLNTTLASPVSDKKTELSHVKKNIDALNLKMERTVEEYNQSENELGQVKKKIHANRLKLEDAKMELKHQQQKLSERIKRTYMQGPMYPLYLIISADSFRQIVENAYYISLVVKSDGNLVDKLEFARKKLNNIDAQLNEQKAKQEILVNKVAAKKVEVEDALAAKNKLLASVKKELGRLQAEERERIKRIRDEALRKLANAKPAANYDGDSSAVDVISIAKKYLGVPYKWGGTSPSTGFDCSGFVWFVYSQVGVSLPRTSIQQYNFLASKGRLVAEPNLQAGDLIFYGRGYVSDVKMYMGSGYVIGANGGQFTPGEVRILPLHYRSDYYSAGRP